MDNVSWMNLPDCFRPSSQSLSGDVIGCFVRRGIFNPQATPCLRVKAVALRTLAALAILMCVAVDLIAWTLLTITIYYASKIGRHHFTNLISLLALPILLLKMPCGKVPKPIDTRPMYCRFEGEDLYRQVMHEKAKDEASAAREVIKNGSQRDIEKCLNVAIQEGDCKAIQVFAQEGGINLNTKFHNAPYGSRLHSRIICEQPGCPAKSVETLIELGADPNKVDDNGVTPLFYAALHSCPDIVKVLLKGGADPNKTLLNERRAKLGAHSNSLVATIMGLDTVAGSKPFKTVNEPDLKDRHQRNLASTKEVVQTLILAEAECNDADFAEAREYARMVNARIPGPNETIINFVELHRWKEEDKRLLEKMNPFRLSIIKIFNFIQQFEAVGLAFPGTGPWNDRHSLKIIAANIEAVAETVYEAKNEAIRRRTKAIADTGHFPSGQDHNTPQDPNKPAVSAEGIGISYIIATFCLGEINVVRVNH